MVRAAALLALVTALVAYSAFAEDLPRLSDWENVAVLAFGVIPVTFALVWLALPVRHLVHPWQLGLAAALLALLAVVLSALELAIAANVVKLAAATAVGWWFLTFFEAAWWVLLVAVLIVPVDLVSVARGPTREITTNRPEVFDALSIFMRIPGEASTSNLGLPDVLFFALFLGAAVRFGLRPGATWAAMTLSFGGTLALAVALEEAGVAALPLLSAAFVLANGDRLWTAFKHRRA
ncbi:MAG TPA: hypothetical protein VHF67_02960 [Gaiellaceae bacterium]|nr:hypothetical protein [Gaiellaceae bacterium]